MQNDIKFYEENLLYIPEEYDSYICEESLNYMLKRERYSQNIGPYQMKWHMALISIEIPSVKNHTHQSFYFYF